MDTLLNTLRVYFLKEVAKHGHCNNYTDFEDYINNLSQYELLVAISEWLQQW